METRARKSAKQYYSDPLLHNLLEAAFKKYRGQNGVRGNIYIEVVSMEEAIKLQEFFGERLKRLIRPSTTIEVPMKVFAEEIAKGYKLDICELYELLNDTTLLTNLEKRQVKNQTWQTLFDQVDTLFMNHIGISVKNEALDSVTFNWFERLQEGRALGYKVVQHTVRKNLDSAEMIFYCLKALWYLFVENKIMLDTLGVSVVALPLPMLAEYITNDPHAFDMKFPAGRLLSHALDDIHNQQIKSKQIKENDELLVHDGMRRRYIYRASGIILDDISSYVHAFVPNEYYGSTAKTLNLSELHASQSWFESGDLYVFENPSVFSFLVLETLHFLEVEGITSKQIPENFPILVCTSGQARDAAKLFIAKCVEFNPSCTIYYSGDFDLPGVQMKMNIESLGNVEFMRMDASTYRKYIQPESLPLSKQDINILERMEGDLPKAMSELEKKVYQERITKDLREDWIQVVRRVLER